MQVLNRYICQSIWNRNWLPEMSKNTDGMNASTSPVTQNEHGHVLQSPFLCPQIPSLLIPINFQNGVQYLSPPAGVFPNGGPSLNVLHVLSGSSAIGTCSNGNFVSLDLRAQGSCVGQNQLLIGSSPGLATTPPPFYQSLSALSSIQRDSRTTHEPISTLNLDQLTAENHPGFGTVLQQRAQGTSVIPRILYHSSPNWLSTGMNSPCQSYSQIDHSFNALAHELRELDLEAGHPFSFDHRSARRNVNRSIPTSSQQQHLEFGGHHQWQEEKHEADNGEYLTSSSDSWRVPVYWTGSSEEKKTAVEKRDKNKKQKIWSKLYGFKSPLHYAIQMNDGSKVRQLLKTSNPNRYHDETGETPMHLACRLGKLHIVKLLRRHPKINMNLKTISGTKASYSHPGFDAVQLADAYGKRNVVNFLEHFKPKDHKKLEHGQIEYGVLKQELDKLRPKIDALTKENEELKKKLKEIELEDAHIMGIKLPRKKPWDTKKLAEVLKTVRELERDLTARQQRMWAEREDEKQCTICAERQKDIVLIPCGHLFCSACSLKFGEICPNCRKRIERRIKTYK